MLAGYSSAAKVRQPLALCRYVLSGDRVPLDNSFLWECPKGADRNATFGVLVYAACR